VPLFARRPAALPVGLPRLDGSGWPDPGAVGRPSFDASTFYELATRQAFEPETHALADRVVDAALPRIPTGASAQDEPFLRKVFTTAARVGAGIGTVERTLGAPQPQLVDRRIAGALWLARSRLPAMRPDWSRSGAWFLLAGYHVARAGPEVLDELVEGIDPAEL
jgi:hypothetical protein